MTRKSLWRDATAASLPLVLAFTALLGEIPLVAQQKEASMSVAPPPMGWSSWNSFATTVNARIVMEEARAMASSGMSKAGYQYINIDEGWWRGDRDSQGNIVVDAKTWPALAPGERDGDMTNIVRFIHGLGLKAGIYTDVGKSGCTMKPNLNPVLKNTGSEGHYDQDFLQFAKWGFDYVKVDWCGGNKEQLDPAVQYAEVARAIARAAAITGNRLYFSICDWGKNSPWTWAPNVGGSPADIWRTSGDIVTPIVAGTESGGRKISFEKMLSNFEQGIHPEAQHTGFYNDPDMMVLGMPGLSDEQNRVHMGLWAISGAPLIVGADLTKLSAATIATLTNRAVLAVDQDGAGLQAAAVAAAEPVNGVEIWEKPLAAPGQRAVLLLNRTGATQQISVRFSDLGLHPSARVKDLWSEKGPQTATGSWTANVPPGDASMLLVAGTELPMARYEPSNVPGTAGDGSEGAILRGHPVEFANVASRSPLARIKIAYRNPDAAPRFAELRVNGQTATQIAFPPAGKALGAVWVQSNLNGSGAGNTLTFSAECDDRGPAIKNISVE